jgi:all-trans-8'-apo-beta-carotenal 15,15'-oxygenase
VVATDLAGTHADLGLDVPAFDDSSLRSTVGRFHAWEPLRTEGTLPAELRGTWIRTGPGVFERFGRRVEHAFEADGVLVGLRIADGRAEGSVRVVESPGYRAEQRAEASLHGSTASWWRRIGNGLRRRTKATGNTSLMHWQDRTFALMESAGPLEIDTRTLDTRGLVDFGGVVSGPFSAHPHRVATRRSTFNFGLHYGPRPFLELYALPDTGHARRLGRVALPWNGMVHDFAVTEHHAVFIICPVKLRVLRAALGVRGFSGIFRWDPHAEAQLLIVPLADIEHPLRLPIEPRFVFHLANAHERGRELVVDLVQYPDLEVLTALSGNSDEPRRSRSRLQRLRVDLASRTLRADETLWDAACEFPIVPAAQVGAPYEALWVTSGDATARGITRIDPRSAAVEEWRPDAGTLATEPMFVPRDAPSSIDGWLVSLTLDATRPESCFAVLDAAAPSAGPIARIWMGQALHSTYHGVHVPG